MTSQITNDRLQLHFKVPPKMRAFFHTQKKFNVAYGGRGSGKSESMAQVAIKESFCCNGFLLLTRFTEKSIDSSSKSVVERWIKNLDLSRFFDIRKSYIKNLVTHSEFIFNGLSLQTMDNIASYDNVCVGWIEEAHNIPEDAWIRFYPSIRGKFSNGDSSRIYITFNPHAETDTFYKWFVNNPNRDDLLIVNINYSDNPFFRESALAGVYENDVKYLPKSYVEHIWEGGLKLYNDESVIPIARIGRYDNQIERKYDLLYISMDTAFSTKESADYSVIIIGGAIEGKIHVLNIFRSKWEFYDLCQALISASKWVQEHYKRGADAILIENKASGQSLIQEIERQTNLAIKKVIPTKDKYSRVCEVLPFIQEGGLEVPLYQDGANIWVKNFMIELELFRADLKHEHDDQVDALTQMLSEFINNKPLDWSGW